MEEIKTIRYDNILIAQIEPEMKINNTANLLDIFATLSYTEQCDNMGIVVDRDSLPEEFFDLSTGIAGEMLQKFSNYGVKLAVVGDFCNVKSQSLRAFIRECNRGRHVFFAQNKDQAIEKLLKLS